MRLNKATARAAMRHYQSPGPASSQFLLDFLRLCVNALPEDPVFTDVGTGKEFTVVGVSAQGGPENGVASLQSVVPHRTKSSNE